MNIFSNKSSIVGDAQITHLNRSLAEFFEQAREIRVRLDKRAYLLDRYLSFLFDAANQTVAINAASEGFEIESAQLNRICLEILRYDEKSKEHPFYEQAKEYIDSHPLPYQEQPTKMAIYCSMLTNDFLRFIAEQYAKKLEDSYSTTVDICDLRDLYRQICGLLGDEETMERLNLLFRQRFLIATAMTIFLQSMTNQLMYSLTSRDRETQKQVFQILLDEQLFSFDDALR